MRLERDREIFWIRIRDLMRVISWFFFFFYIKFGFRDWMGWVKWVKIGYFRHFA